MKYELLLINVSRDYSGFSSSFRDSIGQYSIASYIRMFGFKAYVFAGNTLECKENIQFEIINNKVPIVGFYAAADNIRLVKHMISWIKKEYPFVKTVVGGPQAIDIDLDFFTVTKNDYAIIGEGEIAILYLLEYLIDKSRQVDSIPSLVYRDESHNVLIYNECNTAIIENLDSIPYPSMDDSLKKKLRQGPIVGIITGRGCPYHCTFCYEGANAKNVRFRSIENVMEEIDYIIKHNKNISFISIYDDTFTLKKERVLEFCNKIEKRNLKWLCEGHLRFILQNRDVLKRMIQSGMACIQFGIESGSNKVLSAYNKRTNYQMIKEGISICKQLGVTGITGNFIIGGAFETIETIEESKKLAKELINIAKGIIEIYVVYFAPYPNTKIVNCPQKFDIKICDELENYRLNTMNNPVVETVKLSNKDIYNLKQDFVNFINDVYREAAKNPLKKDVIQGLFIGSDRVILNPTWEKYYMQQPHVANFILHCSKEEQEFKVEKYIIRTFDDILVEKDKLTCYIGEFYGLEKDILINATGIYTCIEMAQKLNVSIKEIEECYTRLNNRCLVYVSDF